MISKKTPVLPGQRILRTAIAVGVCLLIYVLRGHRGIPLYSALAAMQCIQPYTKDMKGVASKRILGTVIGAVWGLLFLLIEIRLISGVIPDEGLHYILVPLVLALVLYSTVLLGVKETAYLAGTVFLVITINHFTDTNPFIFAFNRLLDTVIGVVVASVVNRIHLPRAKNTDTLFVSALGHSLLDSESHLSPYSLVELNRLMDDGMKFSLSTVQTQATVRELLPGVRLRCPIIVMDGAALYDTQSLAYLKTTPMNEEKAANIMSWLRKENTPYFSNSIRQNLLVIHYSELANEGMRQLFEKKRYSAYRNYVKTDSDHCQNVVCVTAIDTTEHIEEVHKHFLGQDWAAEYRVDIRPAETSGFSSMKFYDASCSREAMLRELETRMGTKKTVTFGGVPNKYDVFIENSDRNLLVKELKKRFEPVDWRCWKSVFRW